MNEKKCDYVLKYIILGDSEVGKSNLLRRMNSEEFQNDYNETIGIEFLALNKELDNKIYELKILDTVGNESFRSSIFPFLNNRVCALIVYEIDKTKSFENITKWIEELKRYAPKTVLMILIGNKCDLNEKRKVTEEEGRELAEKNGMLFFETSAKTGKNVEEVLNVSLALIVKKMNENYYDFEENNCGIEKPKYKKNFVAGDTLEKENEIKEENENQEENENEEENENHKKSKCKCFRCFE